MRRMQHGRRWAILAALATAAVLGGCAGYTNIPPQPGDIALSTPNEDVARRVMAHGLAEALSVRTVDETAGAAVRLPAGSKPATYEYVMERLPVETVAYAEGAVSESPVFPLLSVAGVYIRGTEAQVDIAHYETPEWSQLISVYLELTLSGWVAERHRVWQMPVEEALLLANPSAYRTGETAGD